MGLRISHLIFGNGYGMKSPYWDDRYFWLVDTCEKERHERNGRLYTYIGGYGAQLRSFEFRCPRPGERRVLSGSEFRPFNVSRRWFCYDVSWAMSLPHNLNEAQIALTEFEQRLGR